MANFVSFVILVLLFYGRGLARRSRERHARLMAAVIALDVSLIMYLVVARRALSKVTPAMPAALMIHVGFALTTVALYAWAVYVGVRLLRGHHHPGAMRCLDRIIVPTRVMTLLTSLYLEYGMEE